MDNAEMKKCPFCAEMIRTEAIKCRYCGSDLRERKPLDLGLSSPQGHWHRVSEGKKIAGVCTGIAKEFDSPMLIMPLRVFFVVAVFFYFFGPLFYVLLWLLMPASVDGPGATATYGGPAGAGGPVPGGGQAYGVVDTQSAVAKGAGFRYLIARGFGMHMGLDVAQGPDDTAIYIQFGGAWH